jgi:hypothetical protein
MPAVSLSPLFNGWQGFTAGGIPLSGGFLNTYLAGTSTPAATYTTNAGTIANQNPIQLDGGGRPPNEIWQITGQAYRYVLTDSLGTNPLTYDNIVGLGDQSAALQAALADTTSAANGDALLGVKSTLAGANGTTQHEVNERIVSLFTFCSAAQIASWLAGDLTQDFAAPLQALWDAASSATQYGAPKGILPSGSGKTTVKLRCKSRYIHIEGAGMWNSVIVYNGVTAGGIVADAMVYFSPNLHDFSLTGDATSGHGFDASAVTSDMYWGGLARMYIAAGKAALYVTTCFSFLFDQIIGSSITDHVFRVSLGNTSGMRRCYAISAPAGKCGYRLVGDIHLEHCNGVNSLGIWGIFGNDLTAADGWQTDFTVTDYPAVFLQDCNVEAYSVAGIILHNSHRVFSMEGGKFARNALSTDYHSAVWARVQGITPVPLRFNLWRSDFGTGLAKGGTFASGIWTPDVLTNAQLHGAAGVFFEDANGQLAAGLTAYGFLAKSYSDSAVGLVPLISRSAEADVLSDPCTSLNAVTARRTSLQMVRYKTPAALTPVGAAQAIVVTGYTKVTVTPAAAASITTATFDATQGAGLDFDRNGDLLIEAGNGNLTVNHSASGANTFRMAGAANVTMATGAILRFCRSVTSAQWVQV